MRATNDQLTITIEMTEGYEASAEVASAIAGLLAALGPTDADEVTGFMPSLMGFESLRAKTTTINQQGGIPARWKVEEIVGVRELDKSTP